MHHLGEEQGQKYEQSADADERAANDWILSEAAEALAKIMLAGDIPAALRSPRR